MGKIRQISTVVGILGTVASVLTFIPEIVPKIPLILRIIFLLFFLSLILIPRIYSYVSNKIIYFSTRLKRVRIGVCLGDDSQSGEIVIYCNKEIASLGLSSKIKFETQKVKDNDYRKLGKLVSSSNVDVVVWTTINNNTKGKVSINFTYKNTTDNLIAKIVHSELSSLVSREKMFNLNKESLNLDLDLEKNNITNFSLFIVALCTTLLRGNNDGITVFEKLRERLGEESGHLKYTVSEKLFSLYFIQGIDLLNKNKYQESLAILEKGYILNAKNPDLLSNLALSKFFNGDTLGAENISKDLLQNHTGHPIAHLDGAFFRIKNKKYKSALKHYLLFAKIEDEYKRSACIDAIGFMSDRLDEDPKEMGYLFARGFLKRLLDKNNPNLTSVGKTNYVEDFDVFLKRADKIVYKEMVEVATKYLEKVTGA